MQISKMSGSSKSDIEEILKDHLAVIKVIGVGGAGGNTIDRLVESGLKDIELIAVNTDAADLLKIKADKKILIGRKVTQGLGAGADPKVGEDAAKEDEEQIRKAVKGADMVFLACGLGGGTGTGAAPVIANIIKEEGILGVGVATLPFTAEGYGRMQNAKGGLAKLRQSIDTLVVLPNDKLMEIVPDVPMRTAFMISDEILMNAVKGILEIITKPGLINVDFADLKATMKGAGLGVIGIGESNSEQKQVDAVHKAISNPLLAVDIADAKNALVNVTGGPDLTLHQAHDVVKMVSDSLDPEAKVIWGAHIDEKIKDSMRVMVVVTGIPNETFLETVILKRGKKKPEAPKGLEEEFGLEVVVPKSLEEISL